MHSPWFARVGVAALLVPCALSCAMMSQSRKGQELSYRGAWQCAQRGCAPSTMVQSRRGSNQDGVRFNEVSFNPRAAMAFTAASPFDRLEASAIPVWVSKAGSILSAKSLAFSNTPGF